MQHTCRASKARKHLRMLYSTAGAVLLALLAQSAVLLASANELTSGTVSGVAAPSMLAADLKLEALLQAQAVETVAKYSADRAAGLLKDVSVNTPFGRVTGVQGPDVNQFLGIPYAEQPIVRSVACWCASTRRRIVHAHEPRVPRHSNARAPRVMGLASSFAAHFLDCRVTCDGDLRRRSSRGQAR